MEEGRGPRAEGGGRREEGGGRTEDGRREGGMTYERGVRREAGRRHGREGGEDEDNVDDELGAVGWAGLGAFGRVRAGVAGGRH